MTVEIHIWSDYVCPFCLIAEELIEHAIADRANVEVVHHAHELRPYPMPTLRPEDEYLPDIWQRTVYPMTRHHEVDMMLPSLSPQPYTTLAFRGAQYADDLGLGRGYHRRMMTAFFQEDLDIGDREVLTRLAEKIGLDPVAYSAALDLDEYAQRHRRALAESEQMQISVVPTIVIGERRITGVATENVIQRALDKAAAA
ncbi:DsbA family protein [Rhodococcus erythropolis]